MSLSHQGCAPELKYSGRTKWFQNLKHLDMPQADIPCDHRGMFSLSEAFELFEEVTDVGRLDHPDCKVAVAVGLQAALHLDI